MAFHVSQPVRVLHTDWPELIPVGDVRPVKFLGVGGAWLSSPTCDLFFFDSEIEPAGTLVPAAPQTLDHGRLDTLKHHKAFSTVHVEILDRGHYLRYVIPTDDMLSPRRIARILDGGQVRGPSTLWSNDNHRGCRANEFADAAYDLLRSFRDNGFVLPDVLEARVYGWHVRLVANDAA